MKGEAHNTPSLMSTKFFNNIETTLMDKFHGIATAMANFDIFHAVVGYFRSSGYFKLRQELEKVKEIRILVGFNIDDIFRHHNPHLRQPCVLPITSVIAFSTILLCP